MWAHFCWIITTTTSRLWIKGRGKEAPRLHYVMSWARTSPLKWRLSVLITSESETRTLSSFRLRLCVSRNIRGIFFQTSSHLTLHGCRSCPLQFTAGVNVTFIQRWLRCALAHISLRSGSSLVSYVWPCVLFSHKRRLWAAAPPAEGEPRQVQHILEASLYRLLLKAEWWFCVCPCLCVRLFACRVCKTSYDSLDELY